MMDWIRLACQIGVVRRAVICAAIVGPILVAINHGDALLQGEIGERRIVQIVLTFLVPYLVSTFSSVGAIRRVDTET